MSDTNRYGGGLTPGVTGEVAFRRMSGLLRSNVVVASGTALSRITGLLRLVVLGAVLGQTALSDAYLIANETPNIVYELLLGGLLSATLVPLFSTFVENDDDESTNVVLTVSVMLMIALTVVAVVFAPFIFGLYSVNVADGVDADLYRSAGTTLARIFLIQILFYGLVALANAFLNSRRRFFAAAWAPILPNVIIIVVPAVTAGTGRRRVAARGGPLERSAPVDARARRHRRHRLDGHRAPPRDVADRVQVPTELRIPPPCSPQTAVAVGLDVRVRRGQPDRACSS